jgi:hypothetical protein
MSVGSREQVKGLALNQAITVLREMASTPLWRHFCLRVQDLLVIARDELEECETEREMLITQGGIRMLRKVIEWNAELKDDIQKKLMLEEVSANGGSGTDDDITE